MFRPKCRTENKNDAKLCKKCKKELDEPVVLWKPSWKWHARVLAAIYAVLIIAFFSLNYILKPYMRQIPKDITPWIKEVPKQEPVG